MIKQAGMNLRTNGWPLEVPGAAWWAGQAVQASRLAACACLLPFVAAWQQIRLACAAATALGDVAAAQQKRYWESTAALGPAGGAKTPRAVAPPKPSTVPGMTRDDLEELRSAWQEFEETRGDWSKDR
jgi:hypothetical protein